MTTKPKKPTKTRAQELLELLTNVQDAKTPHAKGVAIGNALVFSMPEDSPPSRARVLREYALALIKPSLEHADGVAEKKVPPIMTHEELVAVLLAGAYLVQTDRVLGREVVG